MSHATKTPPSKVNAAKRWFGGFVRVVPHVYVETDLARYRVEKQIGATTWGAINRKDARGIRWMLLYLGLLTVGLKIDPNIGHEPRGEATLAP